MFCKNCGSQLPNDATFCSKCGQEIQTSDVNKSKKPRKKKALLVVGIIMGLFLVFTIVPNMFGNSDPIVGKWRAIAFAQDEDVIPVLEDGYIDIKGNGILSMRFDEDTIFSGTWKRDEGTLSTDSGIQYIPYSVEFTDTTGILLFNYEENRIFVIINDITTVFEKY